MCNKNYVMSLKKELREKRNCLLKRRNTLKVFGQTLPIPAGVEGEVMPIPQILPCPQKLPNAL